MVSLGCASADEGEPVVSVEETSAATESESSVASGAGEDEIAPADGDDDVSAERMKITVIAEGLDDVGANASSPLVSGTLAFVPVADEAEVWAAIEYEPSDDQLSTVGGLVPRAVIPAAAMVTVADGAFSADPADGDYLVCLVTGDDPVKLKGCDRMTVNGPETWGLTFGEGGLFVSARG